MVDTLARNFGAGDENSTQEMGAFVAAMDDLRSNWPGSVILIVHHSGHAEKQRARGAMALKGALDFEYRLEKDGLALTLANTKMKDAEPPADLFFSLASVDLEGGAKSAVLTATDAPERRAKMNPAQRLALSTYEAAAKEHGAWEGGAFKGVHLDHWRDAFYAKHTGDTTDAKKKAFQRVRSALAEAGRIEATDDTYLIKDPDLQLSIVMHRDKRDKCLRHVPCPGLGQVKSKCPASCVMVRDKVLYLSNGCTCFIMRCMNTIDILTDTKLHARVDGDDDDTGLVLMLAAAAADVAHAAAYTLPTASADLPDDLRLAIIDQAAMLYDARGCDTERPAGLSMAAARIVSRYRGVRLCTPTTE